MNLARQEHARITVRTRRAQITSFLVHLVLLTMLALRPVVFPEPPALTEIAWIDPESLESASPPPGPLAAGPASAPAPATQSEPVSGQQRPHEEKQFERTLTRSEAAPALQTSRALQDVLNARASSMQRQAQAGPVRPIAAPAAIPMAGAQLAGVGSSPTGTGIGLRRGGGGGGAAGNGGGGSKPLALVRAGTGLPSSGLSQLATVSAPKFESEKSRPQDVDDTRVRELAGASLIGPIVDRDVLNSQTPIYPDWAEVQGVEATVSLYFVVRPDGRIKENILVEKTSGFEDFDANAVTALRNWRFEALGGGATGEQWGRITFHYRLSAG
ncbi:MAG TPA: energy transducer TonB [Candidatus Krumholzibacteria bacterium]|nr:energy transducer TonB [Candidatus Krumholzibacteria bacterium]